MSNVVWQPDPARIAASNMQRLLQQVQADGRPEIIDYPSLWHWSVTEPESFWQRVAGFCGVEFATPAERALASGSAMPEARWFHGATLNFAEHLLRFRDDHPALIFRDETGARSLLTYAELHDEVARVAAGLRELGIQPGDRVAAFLPNRPETVIAMLAAASLGAIFSSCSPDFGAQGVLDRFGQIEPKVLFAATGYRYNGRQLSCMERIGSLQGALPSLQRTVLVGDADAAGSLTATVPYSDFGTPSERIDFAHLPFDHPLYILFSSGTTGVPKCIVHGAGGTLLQHLKELVLHTDLRREDRILYVTTCGWMMWNWLVSGLAVGATVVLYDGAPMYPRRDALFRVLEEEAVTVFGTSARYLAAVEKAGVEPGRDFDLAQLRTLLSTGSPLLPEQFDWVYGHVKADLQLASISGGTDIVSCFALGSPLLPVRRGELQCRGLGMAVDVFDEQGQPVRQTKGELICTRPFPSMPVGFWNDPDGSKYRAAYFERFAGIWCHGDFAELTEHDGLIIHGRSDATLNPGGVRIGTAEIYRQVEKVDEVVDCLVIGQDFRGDVRVVLFVVLRQGSELDEEVISRIRGVIRANATPRHVPAKILAVTDLPRTVSNKISEIAVRDVVHGRPVANTEALLNPEVLEQFRDRPELRS
ncbi:MAG: acetoacetate--CoA ligase [Gammaproteobacteria bacterium]|nr:acetoacetate--CoA ligase [Gammaproteobacteria bacterium]